MANGSVVFGGGLPVAVSESVVTGTVLAGCATAAAYAGYVRFRRLWSARRRIVHSRRVELAAEEAVFEDPAFAPELVKSAAAELHAAVIAAWSADDRKRLKQLLGAELLESWTTRLEELRRKGLTNPLRRRGRLRIRYVGLVNRPGDPDDRVVVHVRARMDDGVYDRRGRIVFRDTSDSGRRTHSEYWTLAKRDGRWILVTVEAEEEGAHNLTGPIIAAPWADDRLSDRATFERAAASTVEPEVLAEIAPFEFAGDLRVAALDLAAFDGRYAPDVLEASARQAVAAWTEAVNGNDGALAALVGDRGVNQLLYPDGSRRRRLVIRGARLRDLRIVELNARARPPAMTVLATIVGRRYVESRATGAVIQGRRDQDSTFTVRWELRLSRRPETPWRIVRTTVPVSERGAFHRFTVGLVGDIFDVFLGLFGRPSRW
ncbi:MAG: TIM44-like domain-containing protein [Actinomycetota bacterium]|jgi:predicted lipid-binding transport protein (Tim44 family)